MSCTARGYPANLEALMRHIHQPRLQEYIRRFLFDTFNPESPIPGCDVALGDCPPFAGRIYVYHSATSTYYAPSDVCGVGGMHRETIRATPSWYRGAPRYDTVFVANDQDVAGFAGLHVARVMLFFDFKLGDVRYPCALVEWFIPSNTIRQPCEVTGMWVVERDLVRGQRVMSVIHTDTILRAAHLMALYGDRPLPRHFRFHQTLHSFHSYYVNKFIDYHAHEIVF
jgi:hypothetical protein